MTLHLTMLLNLKLCLHHFDKFTESIRDMESTLRLQHETQLRLIGLVPPSDASLADLRVLVGQHRQNILEFKAKNSDSMIANFESNVAGQILKERVLDGNMRSPGPVSARVSQLEKSGRFISFA